MENRYEENHTEAHHTKAAKYQRQGKKCRQPEKKTHYKWKNNDETVIMKCPQLSKHENLFKGKNAFESCKEF